VPNLATTTRSRYERQVSALIRRSDVIQLADLRRIEDSFRSFASRAVGTIPGTRFALSTAINQSVLSSVAVELDQLVSELGVIGRGGMANQAFLAGELRLVYGQAFLPGSLDIAGNIANTARAIDVASDFSADLIGLSGGGLRQKVLDDVNGIVRRAALGIAGQTAFDATSELVQAFRGDRLRSWRFAAERIYRTETLRLHSILTEQNIRELNERVPTSKSWRWSGISRREHASINGQTVPTKRGRFRVPLRSGGAVKLRFPRDPGGPPEAVINCGCYLVPVPSRTAKGPPAARPSRARRPRPPKPRPAPTPPAAPIFRPGVGSPTQRITAAKRELNRMGIGERTVRRGPGLKSDELFARTLERVAVEHASMVARYPGANVRNLPNLVANRGGGGWHRTSRSSTISVGSTSDFSVAGHLNESRITVNGAQVWRRSTTTRGGHGVEDVWRHEWGHHLDSAYAVQSSEEWRALMRRYPTRAKVRSPGENYRYGGASWWAENVESQYAARWYSWEGTGAGGGGVEAWAELVSFVTRENYIRGTLPADLEAFVFRILERGRM